MRTKNIIFFLLLVVSIFGLSFFIEKLYQSQNVTVATDSKQNLANHFVVYSAIDDNGPLKLLRHGRSNDGGYVVAEEALKQADVVIGYGISTDISFEEMFSDIYKKPAFGFDCGVSTIAIKNPLTKFYSECIASDKHLYKFQSSSGQFSTFSKQIEKLGLQDKKIFLKMDIEGAEYDAFADILTHAKNLTGIALEIHYRTDSQALKAIELLEKLKENFVLIHIHGNNCCNNLAFTTANVKGNLPVFMELSFVNRSLVKTFEKAKDQSHPTKMDMPNISSLPEAQFEIIPNQ